MVLKDHEKKWVKMVSLVYINFTVSIIVSKLPIMLKIYTDLWNFQMNMSLLLKSLSQWESMSYLCFFCKISVILWLLLAFLYHEQGYLCTGCHLASWQLDLFNLSWDPRHTRPPGNQWIYSVFNLGCLRISKFPLKSESEQSLFSGNLDPSKCTIICAMGAWTLILEAWPSLSF